MNGLRPKELAAKSATNGIRIAVSVVTIVGCLAIGYFSSDAKEAIGKISGFIIAMASIPYIVSIFKNGTRPSRTTWWIWTMLSILISLSYHESGASNTLWVPIVYVGDQLIVALISLTRYGEGGRGKLDIACMTGAFIGVLLWWLSGSAVLALAAFISADLFGSVPTIEKSRIRPESEDIFAWVMTVTGNTLNIFAAERLVPEILAYPFYAAITSGVILYFLLRRKIKV